MAGTMAIRQSTQWIQRVTSHDVRAISSRALGGAAGDPAHPPVGVAALHPLPAPPKQDFYLFFQELRT